MGRGIRRLAAVLLLAAALTNGLFGPLVHGHALASAEPASPASQTAGAAAHVNCHAAEPDDPAPADPASGKHTGGSGLLCSGSAACCAAVAAFEMPVIEHRARVAPRDYLRPLLAGLTPPVGERPPSAV